MQPEGDGNYWQPGSEQLNDTTVPSVADQPPQDDDVQPLSWQASEYVHQEKSGAWFLGLLGVAATLLLLDVFLIKSWTFGALIVVMAIASIVIARRPPHTLNYSLTPHGIHVNEKSFNFHDFRAFGVVQEGAFYSLRLIPNKRFLPAVSVFFPTELGETIVDTIGHILPMERIEPDPLDKLFEKIRF